jgi:hypothetical protein
MVNNEEASFRCGSGGVIFRCFGFMHKRQIGICHHSCADADANSNAYATPATVKRHMER